MTFKVKDYRINGPGRYKTMTLDAHEFIRRFLIHVLPKGFHRIRHYGLLRQRRQGRRPRAARELLAAPAPAEADASESADRALPSPCPVLRRPHAASSRSSIAADQPRHRPSPRRPHQDRHLMKPRDADRKTARPPTDSSTGNGRAHPDHGLQRPVTAPSAFNNPECRFPNSSAQRMIVRPA